MIVPAVSRFRRNRSDQGGRVPPVAESERAPIAAAGFLGLAVGLGAVGALALLDQIAPGDISARISVRAMARSLALPRSLAGVSLVVGGVDLWLGRRGRRRWPVAVAATSVAAWGATDAAMVFLYAGSPVW